MPPRTVFMCVTQAIQVSFGRKQGGSITPPPPLFVDVAHDVSITGSCSPHRSVHLEWCAVLMCKNHTFHISELDRSVDRAV